MNLLVTGSSGFVGRNIQLYFNGLSEEYTFIPLGREKLSNDEGNNIKDILLSTKESALIHLAGKAHDLKKTSSSSEYYTVNTELTKKVFDAFLKSDSKCFIFLSSVKAVADEVVGELLELFTPNPITHYGKSKLLAEEYNAIHNARFALAPVILSKQYENVACLHPHELHSKESQTIAVQALCELQYPLMVVSLNVSATRVQRKLGPRTPRDLQQALTVCIQRQGAPMHKMKA